MGTRRAFIQRSLAAAALAAFPAACRDASSPSPPAPSKPPVPEPVYALTDGFSLYDDFDGHGNYQTFDKADLAEPGRLSDKLWLVYGGADIVADPVAGTAESPDAGRAEVSPSLRGGNALRITNRRQGAYTRLLLNNPPEMHFADYRSFSADVMLSSASPCPAFRAGFDLHTTIPEQPPGKSWYADVCLLKNLAGDVLAFAFYANYNLGIYTGDFLGPAAMDRWFNLRMDVVTHDDDDTVGGGEFRLDYYLDGVLKASRFPEDAPILLDPLRIGWGPQRSCLVVSDAPLGECTAFFDNVRAVYKDRIG
jgi:hypothetical protein